jgi:S-(hydroxymethyl)glutathione dehydrogenase/alcohol dehydrogenase
MILGHEGSGIVESVGEGVTNFAPGDHVIPSFMPLCQKCPVCQHEKGNFCYQFLGMQFKGLMPDGTSRIHSKDGQALHPFLGCGTFSEYAVVSQMGLVKINSKAALEKVCLLGCGVSTGLLICV